MRSLWFVMPVHGRLDLATICLRQLRHTCDALLPLGIQATAVIVADKENMIALKRMLTKTNKQGVESYMLGFGTVVRDNEFLSRRFNDGIQLACDPRWNPKPADYVVPIGSDDWIDYRLLTNLPSKSTVVGFKHIGIVREDGREMVSRYLDYDGGAGIRIYPRELMSRVDYRPAEEDRSRGCDTSILKNLRDMNQTVIVDHREIDPRQLVDWKTRGQQLNSFDVLGRHRGEQMGNPFRILADIYPGESLRAMRRYYQKACGLEQINEPSPPMRSLARSTGATLRARPSRP